MPGCSAGYCTNSSVKGFQMCRFPKDEKRRKIWLENVNRPDWIPGSNCTLCEEHFEEDMWEKTRNGKRRLKNTAIPTIFSHSGNNQMQYTSSLVENKVLQSSTTSLSENVVTEQGKSLSSLASSFSKIVNSNEEVLSKEGVALNCYQIEEQEGESSNSGEAVEQEDAQNNAMLQEEFIVDKIPQMEVEKVTEGHKDSYAGSSDRNILNRLHKLEKLYAVAVKSKIKLHKELRTAKKRISKLEKDLEEVKQEAARQASTRQRKSYSFKITKGLNDG